MPTKLLSNKTEIPFYNPVKHRLPKNYVKSLLLYKLNVLLFKFYDVTAILAIWPCCSKTAISTLPVKQKLKWICNDSTDIFNGSKCPKFNATK